MNERLARQEATVEDFSLASLRLSWCSDCRADQLFERLLVDEADARASAQEWACTVCGAAYFDGIDVVLEPPRRTRGVA
ncbi:MAG TPA: hypothetical protein VMT88_02705 [Actinomycetes bacterium]|nr:hypothetical protein [Actinomycetes bacterium]